MTTSTAERSDVQVPAREQMHDELNLTFIDQSQDARDAAKLAGEALLTRELNTGGRVKRFLKGIWKGNVAREYYVHKYTRQAQAEIEESGNVLVREADPQASREAQLATIDRFQSEYDEAIHEEAGEHREILADDDTFTSQIKDLIRKNVNGDLSDEAMLEGRTRILNAWAKQHPEQAGEGKVRIDNMVEIAQAVKGRITHDNSLEDVLAGLKVTMGESRSGVRTEVKYNKVEKIIEKIERTRGGAIASVVSPEVLAGFVTVAASLLRFGSTKVWMAATKTFAPGIGVGVAAGLRENKHVKEERNQHSREMAQGKDYDRSGNAKRRDEMEGARYETALANDLAQALDSQFNEEGQIQDVSSLFDALTETEARIKASDGRHIDLISYSEVSHVEQERLLLDIARARAKVSMRNQLTPDQLLQQIQSLRALDPSLQLADDASFDDVLSASADVYTRGTIEGDISAKDKAFRRLKAKRVAIAVGIGMVGGATAGLLVQEGIAALDSTRAGLVEELWNAQNHPYSDGLQHQTLLHGFVHGEGVPGTNGNASPNIIHHNPSSTYDPYKLGDRAKLQLSSDHHLVHNPNGTIDIVDPNGNVTINDLPVDKHGELSADAIRMLRQNGMVVDDTPKSITHYNETVKNVGLKEFLHNHKGDVTHVHRDEWYDENTAAPVFEKNELGLWWGGHDNMGVGKDGSYRFTIQGMTADGSYHGDHSVNWAEAAKHGKIQLAISASEGSQAHPFMIDVDEHGNAIIPKDSPVAQLFSVDKDGHAVFHGKYVEVSQLMGKDDKGVEHLRILATHSGENDIDKLHDVVKEPVTTLHHEYKITTAGYDTTEAAPTETPAATFTEMAPTIPVIPRRALENLSVNETEEIIPPYYSYNFGRMSREEVARFERTISPFIRENPDAALNPQEEFDWYRNQAVSVSGAEYVEELDQLIAASPELSSVSNELQSMIMIPVKATGEAESRNIYNLLRTYAQQGQDALRKNIMLLHVNWFQSAEADPAQAAAIALTRSEIERAKADFPELKVATIESQWTDEQRKGGIIGHVARRMNDAAILALQKAIQDGRMDAMHDVLLIRNDADPKGISRNYLDNYIKSFEANGDTDVFTGTTRFDNRKAKDLPGFVLAANFMQSIQLIASAKEKRAHTGGANFGVRASTFAAVCSAAARESWNGAGSDDVMIGRRIVAARDAQRRGYYGRQGLAGYFDRLRRRNRSTYQPTYNSSQTSNGASPRKVGAAVFGAQIDTDSDRQEALYLKGVPIVHTWDSENGFDNGGHKDRDADLAGPQMVALKEQARNDTPDVVVERLRRDMEGSINGMGASGAVIDTALSLMFAAMSKEAGVGYVLHGKDQGNGRIKYTLNFTGEGIAYIKNKLIRDGRGRFDPYGSRLSRQLYGEVNAGARRQRAGAPLSSIA